MKKPVSLIVFALMAGALLVAGCGSSNSAKDTSSSAQSTSSGSSAGGSSSSGGSAASGSVVKVTMKNIMFNPGSVTAKVGQTVEWTNNDPVAHTVTAKSDGIDSGNVNPGKTFKFTIKKPGVIHYVCLIHAGQKGTINVTS
jgi:plastocyanin